jgi:hypothetical protein
MPPRSSESEDFFVVSTDPPRYSHNGAHSSPASASIDAGRPSNRDGKRSSAGRRSARHDPLDRLRSLPEIRPIPWYPGKELPPAKSTESDRVQTRSACLMVSRGNVNDPPCTHCATGLGRFSLCVSLDEFLSGACSTCHLAARGNSCSLRRKAAAGRFSVFISWEFADCKQVSNPKKNPTQMSEHHKENPMSRELLDRQLRDSLNPQPHAPARLAPFAQKARDNRSPNLHGRRSTIPIPA